ncbi:MAG: hypothetical protein H7Y27_10460 [Gemmatimonadaceae bacterium]|nr:hypothetical protein [Chitinophagaceae bacterium]
MNRELYLILGLSIVIAATIGLIRFRKIEKTYRPFLIYVFVSVLNELGSFYLAPHKESAMIDLNLFTLFEYCILLLQFHSWKLFHGYKQLFYALLAGFVILWVTENLVISDIRRYNYAYILVHSFVMVLLGINMINRIAVNDYGPLYRNARFIICIGLIIFFIYNIIVNTLFLNAASKPLAIRFFNIRVYVNTFSNLLYAIAVYFMPVAVKKISFLK